MRTEHLVLDLLEPTDNSLLELAGNGGEAGSASMSNATVCPVDGMFGCR